MNFMHASGLWIFVGIVPIIFLYVLKARRIRVRVPSTWLWLGAQRDQQVRSPWRKLKRELPLLLEILALAFIAFGLGAPACRGRSIVGAHVAIVVDVSASMAAVDEHTHRPRIDAARESARQIVDSLAIGSDATLIASGRDARVVFPLGPNRSALRSAIDHLSVQDVEGDIAGAVALAVDRLRALSGTRRVIVVTDGATGRTESLQTGPIPIRLLRVGEPQDNVAIVRMDVRTARQGRETEQVQAFALIANHGLTARDVYVTARRDGQTDVIASRRLRLIPGQREPVVLAFPLASDDVGRGLVVDVDPHDALATDDVAYGRIPPGANLPVVLSATNESTWIHRALASDPDVSLTLAPSNSLDTVPNDALIVLDGACPRPLPEHHDVVIFSPPVGQCAGVTVQSAIEAPSITSFVHTDARFRFLTMDGVHLGHATPLALGPSASELLRAGDNTVFADDSTPERAITVVGLDVGDSDWPLRASFVLFIRNLEELARAHRARSAVGGGRTGEPLRIAVPIRARDVRVMGPAGVQPVTVTAGSAVIGETTRAGFYRLSWTDGATLAPINLLSETESNLRVAPLHMDGGTTAVDLTGLIHPHEELSPWAALIVALLLLSNLVWLTRRERKPSTKVRAIAPETLPGNA